MPWSLHKSHTLDEAPMLCNCIYIHINIYTHINIYMYIHICWVCIWCNQLLKQLHMLTPVLALAANMVRATPVRQAAAVDIQHVHVCHQQCCCSVSAVLLHPPPCR